MVALLVFIMATLEFLAAIKMLDGRGPFGGKRFKKSGQMYVSNGFSYRM